jgi:hypothetical protein
MLKNHLEIQHPFSLFKPMNPINKLNNPTFKKRPRETKKKLKVQLMRRHLGKVSLKKTLILTIISTLYLSILFMSSSKFVKSPCYLAQTTIP